MAATVQPRPSVAVIERAARRWAGRIETVELPKLAAALWERVDESRNAEAVALLSFLAAVVESEWRRRAN